MEVAWLVFRQVVVVLCIVKVTCQPLTQMRAPIPTFQILRNHTIPCPSSVQTRGLQRALTRVELTDAEKLQILQSLGGQYVPNYMATDEATAKSHFHNLLGIPRPQMLKMNIQQQAEEDKDIKKNDLLSRIRQYLSEHDSAATSPGGGQAVEEDGRRDTRRVFSPLATMKRSIGRGGNNRGADSPSYRDSYILPPENIGIRHATRGLSGEQTSTDYCINRGSTTPDGAHLHLCTTCAATTTLPTNHWPRVINEATCSTADTGCLHADGIAHGRCEEVVIPMNLLRKKTGYCVLATRGNERVVVDDWEIYTQPIRVGCKCTVDATSFFANFV